MIVLSVGLSTLFFVWAYLGYEQHLLFDRKIAAALHLNLESSSAVPSQRRISQCLRHLPDFLDLLSLGLSAGLTLERAWDVALGYLPNSPLLEELVRTQQAWRMGRARRESMEELRVRLQDPALTMVFALLEQALTRGGSLQDVLSTQSQALRKRRLLAIEKRAQTVGLRLLFPIFVFIFPTVFLILFAPLIIRLSQGVSLF